MYSFANKNGISVLADGKEVIKNITAWINPKLNPYKPNPYNEASVIPNSVNVISANNIHAIIYVVINAQVVKHLWQLNGGVSK